MSFYWLLLAILIVSISVIFLASKFAVELKHLYDEEYKPRYHINEAEIYVSGFFFGALGLLISYLAFPTIRKNDSLNSYRFLWISLGFLVLQIVVIVLLAVFSVLTFEGF